MYKFLLSQRYLRTRYIALASIISVTLGVATMIIVNSVMAGFQNEMYKRLHGILSDIVVEAHSLEGIPDPDRLMDEIRAALGSDVAAMTPNIHLPAMLSFKLPVGWHTKHVNLIGIDEETYTGVSDFDQYLLHPRNRERLSFELRDGGFDSRLGGAGWIHRRNRVALERAKQQLERQRRAVRQRLRDDGAEVTTTTHSDMEDPELTAASDPFAGSNQEPVKEIDPMIEPYPGIVLGIAIASVRQPNSAGEVVDYFLLRPGDDVNVSFPSAGTPPTAIHDTFTVVDMYESKMSEYDSSFAFVPLKTLQEMRGMIDPETGVGAVTAVQIKLADGADLNAARDKLRTCLPMHKHRLQVQTWKDMQGPLMAAVQMETTILNILLFLIITVAGFGILATFFMIVVEKTRDIGILKSLGASNQGVMTIFLSYGLSLGTVGSGVGMLLGLLFVANINSIAHLLETITGRELFDPTIYYFQSIPTIVNPFTVAWIVLGAIGIAIMASVLPAIRAARLHPVEALRYE
jgi:lipoprotein-releasing system permease protein